MVGIARDATGELGPRIEQLAIRVLTAVEDGALLDRDLAGVRAMLHARPQNTMAARRAIADQVLDAGGYALGLPSG